MLQKIEQTDEEKYLMYNKLSKKELILMLIEANKHLDRQPYYTIDLEVLKGGYPKGIEFHKSPYDKHIDRDFRDNCEQFEDK